MPINAVSSAGGAVTQAVQQRKSQESEAPKPEAQKRDAAASADEAAKARQAQAKQQAQQPKPVVNAEGQKTGQVINVTA